MSSPTTAHSERQESRPPQTQASAAQKLPLNLFFLAVGITLCVAVDGQSRWLASDVADALVRNTIRLSLAWYAVALLLFMRLGPSDWRVQTPLGQVARWCWTWSLVCFLIHMAMAFHYVHHWSHCHAFERTRQVSGNGEGIFVSYMFAFIWAVDVLWWWLSPAGYAARWRWIDRLLHASMLFVVFNGTVVFETGPIRWAGLTMFAIFAIAWISTWRLPKPSAAK